jgi:peptide-methionine (S)-S-oxide reductase
VRVIYDPQKSQLPAIGGLLLAPHRSDGQGPPVLRQGQYQYRSGIYWQNETERARSPRPVVTNCCAAAASPASKPRLAPALKFWPAEDYHQDYYKKNPIRYNYYRFACGRDARVQEIWGSK